MPRQPSNDIIKLLTVLINLHRNHTHESQIINLHDFSKLE